MNKSFLVLGVVFLFISNRVNFKKSILKLTLFLFLISYNMSLWGQSSTLSKPSSSSNYSSQIPVSLTINEAYSTHTAKLTFTNTAGTYSNTLTLIDNISSLTFTITTGNLSNTNIFAYSHATLPDDTYNLTLSYQDLSLHAPIVVTNTNILVQTSTPVPTITSPANGTVFNSSSLPAITYNLPSAPLSGTAILTLTPSYNYTLTNQVGTNTYTITSNLPADGTYTGTVSYSDFLGNPIATSAGISLIFNRTTLTPTITTPSTNSTISGTLTITYTTPEAALTGSRKLIFSKNSTAITTLILNDNNSGTVNLNPTNFNENSSQYASLIGASSIEDGTYSVTYSYQDQLGNPSASSTINLNIDERTLTPILIKPTSSSSYASQIPVSLTLGENYLSGTAKIRFTNTAGTYSNTLTLIDNTLAQTFTITTSNITGSNIVSSSHSNIPDDSYNITLSYQDAYGHLAATVTNTNILVQTSTPVPTITSPANGTVFTKNNLPSITYNIPSTPYTGTAILTLSPGYSFTLTNQAGSNTYTFTTELPIDGTYTCTVRYRDFLGNPASISSPISVTFDNLNSTRSISANGFKNKKNIADWTKQNGPASTIWWDMDNDGQSDKLYFEMNKDGFGLVIYKYEGNCYKKTIDVNDLVIGDSLRVLYNKIVQSWPSGQSMHTGASLNVVDFNKDGIPDLLFEVGSYESEISSNNIPAYDILLVSKGWLKYEMHTFPTSMHAQMTSSGDFNGDGYPDIWKSSVTINDNSYSSYHMIRYLYKDYTSKEVILDKLGRQDDQGTSYITDIDNNGIPDVFIGERDYNLDLGNGIPGKSPRLFMNVNNEFWDLDKSLYDVNFQQKWKISPTRFQITQSIAFTDLNKDGLMDVVLNKVHSNAAPAGFTSDGNITATKNETVIEIFQNDGNGNFHDITGTWFKNNSEYLKLPLNSAGPFYPPGSGNPNPGDLKMTDVDGDGLVDIAFVYYGNIYFKNMGTYFEFKRNDDGFPFVSQKYRSIPDPNFKLNTVNIQGYLSIPFNDNKTTINVDTAGNLDNTKWYKDNILIGSSFKISLNTEGDYKVVRTDSVGCDYNQSFKIIKAGQIGVRYKSFKINADNDLISKGLGGALPALNEAVSGSILYTLNGTEHIIGTPAFGEKALPPVHFINKNGTWVYDRFYTNVEMGNARNYVFIDSSTIAMADHGLESGNPWPYGDIYTIKTLNDTLKWKKVSQYKSFYHSVAMGDINNDGKYDLIGLHMGSYNTWKGNNGLHPYIQNADSTFSEGPDLIGDIKGFGGGGSVLIADIMGDSKPEIIEGQYGTGGTPFGFNIYGFDSTVNKYMLKKKPKNTGVFAAGLQGSTSIKLADFNNDGIKDMAIASEGYPGTMLQIWTGQGNGDFIPGQVLNYPDVIATGYPDSSNTFREFEIADVDNDGWLDILVHPFHFGNKFRINPGPNNPNPTNGGWVGSGIYLQNQIWKNFGGYFNTIQNNLPVYGSYPGFIKGFYLNNKLKFFGFMGNGMNSVMIEEYTITFCNNLVKPTFNSTKLKFCYGDSINLSITNLKKGDTLKWNINNISNSTYSNLKTIKDNSIVYVTRIDSLGCAISSDTINIVFKDNQPLAPVVTDTVFCQNALLSNLNAIVSSGNTLNWYGNNLIGGVGTTTQMAGTADTTTKSYYVSQANTITSCESPRSKITVKINAAPAIPIFRDTFYCSGAKVDSLNVKSVQGSSIIWYGTNALGGTGSNLAIIPNTTSPGTINYYMSQKNTTTGCESIRAKLIVNIYPTPIILRDTSNYLISSVPSGNTWYKDGMVLPDTTFKFKPILVGSYKVKIIQSGCSSTSYYYLVTDVINLNDNEFIKLAPNPFLNQLNFDFVVKGYQRLNIEVYDLATGTRVAIKQNLTAGMPITLGQLSAGTYLIKVTSNDNKISYQFKMVKL